MEKSMFISTKNILLPKMQPYSPKQQTYQITKNKLSGVYFKSSDEYGSQTERF